MLDFPSSPAVNDRYQGFVWDGSVWGKPRITPPPSDNQTYVRKNGVWVPGVRKETITLTNKNDVIITVPSEAKIMRWWGNPPLAVTGMGVTYVVMRLSVDGTNFGSSPSQYGTDGFYELTGTGAFTRWTPTSDTFAYIAPAPTADSSAAQYGHAMHGILSLERADVSTAFVWKTYGIAWQNNSNQWVRYELRGWTSTATFTNPATDLRIKAVRMYTSTGQNWDNVTNVSLQVEWLA